MIVRRPLYGFIDYYVGKQQRRIPVSFFDTANGQVARLSGCLPDPLLSSVIPEHRQQVVGDFSAVLSAYATESRQLLKTTSVWLRCAEYDAGLLALFQTMVAMRQTGCDPATGLQQVIETTHEIYKSEKDAVEAIRQMFLLPDFLTTERHFGAAPENAQEEKLFYLV